MPYELRSGFRLFRLAPAFAATTVLTLAVGIGANTAMFSVVDRVLLHTVPYPDADRLVVVWNRAPSIGYAQLFFSPGDFVEYREKNHVFGEMGAGRQVSANLTGIGDPQRISIGKVTASLFQTLQIQPLAGRVFTEREDHPQPDPVVVVSPRLARRLFLTENAALGHSVTIDGAKYDIVGIMPTSFQFPSGECDAWIPLGFGNSEPHLGHNYTVLARMKPRVTMAQAQAEVDSLAKALTAEFPKTNAVIGSYVETLQDSMVGKIRPALFVLLSAVGLVLVMSCANVANLLLARASTRQVESALRMALGASRTAIVRQFLFESLPLSLAGGAAGLLFAVACLKILRALVPASVPGAAEIAINTDVLLFTLLASLLTSFFFALAPALRASHAHIAQELHTSTRLTADPRRLQLRSILIVSELALATTLLIGAGLLIQSFARLTQIDAGFRSESVVTMTLSIPERKYATPAQMASFYRELMVRVIALPGVRYAGLVNRLPLGGEESSGPVTVESAAGTPKQLADIGWRATSPQYFRAMGIPLLQGREFTDSDVAGRAGVVIIDDLTAHSFWPGENPIGKRLKLGMPDWDVPWLTIVGVVGHVRHSSLDAEAKMQLYWPFEQRPEDQMTLVTKADGDLEGVASAVRAQIAAIDKDQPVSHVSTLAGVLSDSLSQRRFTMMLLAIFAGIALTLAVVGIYGVTSYAVSLRTREIGVRMSLGARRLDVLTLVLGEVARLAGVGLLLGLVCTAATSRLLRSLLFGVNPSDPFIWGLGVVVLMFVALLGGFIPAMRAARTPLVEALRAE